MAKNKLSDLNDHLFAQLERLSDETVKPEVMEQEIQKANAISRIASQIITAGNLTLNAAKLISDGRFTSETGEQVKKNLLT